MAILQLVDQMTDLLNEGREVPLSRYRMVDAEEFSQMLERMRISVPSSIRESERTLIERDNILAGARAEADKIIQEARDIASEMLGENSLVVMARQEAHRIIEDGHEVARQRTSEADGYATQVLQELHEKLDSISGQVENGIAMMTQQGDHYDDPAPRYETPEYNTPNYNASNYSTPQASASGFMAADGQGVQRRSTTPITGTPLTSRSPRERASFDEWSQEDALPERSSRGDGFEERMPDVPYSETAQHAESFRSEPSQFGRGEFSGQSFNEDGPGDHGFNAGGFDNSQFDNNQFENNEFDDYVEPQYGSDRQGNNSSEDTPLQAPTLNYLSDPSDPMSDHL